MMKYGIEKLVYVIKGDVREAFDKIENEDPCENLEYVECYELVDTREEAEAEFENLMSSIRQDENGDYIMERYAFEYGEAEIDPYILEDDGEEVYVFKSYTEEKTAPFDKESLSILEGLGVNITE